ncbi:IS66 family transposase (plasmid) [Candidatus Chlorohelix allophototropha]|uniref:IS66 family transposase n=1 Tax=Candidatus Chlorohelix allophototropha TaxID=3003348 RepID=A0ABY9BAA4_9CHLR|nr:IS66 family transposase [Chloroflexota bacterium L227-S17]
MTLEEQLAQLQNDYAQLEAKAASQAALIAQLIERIQTLEARLSQDSHNSSKPPSSDGFKRSPKKRSLRKSSGKKPGGQPGHEGQALKQSENPDTVIAHLPTTCEKCQTDLTKEAALPHFEPRQVFELPTQLKLHVTEHRTYSKKCPTCQTVTKAKFPQSVKNWVQYGPGFRALAVYLITYQLLPYARVCELLNEIYSESLSPGSLVNMIAECYEQLAEPEKTIKTALTQVKVLHCDETGLYVEGKRHWLHVASTPHLTHYAHHLRRGSKATDEIGILPAFQGAAIHDGWSNYLRYACTHGLCNAHHLRELAFVYEQLKQAWAAEFTTLLVDLKEEVEVARARSETSLSSARLAHFEERYQQLIAQGLAANPPPQGGWPCGKRGKPRQSKPKNLLDRLDKQRHQVLLFAYRFDVPFDNNLAERDIRMVKVQQKVSGCFRSQEGASFFCRIRGYLSTMKKQGENLLVALLDTFCGQPPLPKLLV